MTDFEKQQIRALASKEWRAIRDVVILCFALVATPSLLSILSWDSRVLDLTLAFLPAASVLACIGLGIQSYGLEFNEKTLAYLSTRPISPTSIFLIKALLGLGGTWAVGTAALSQVGGIAGFLTFQSKSLAGIQWLIEWQVRWMLVAPAIFFLVQASVLLIRPMVPALIASIELGLLATGLLMSETEGVRLMSFLLAPLLLIGFGWVSYRLAQWRMRHAAG